MNLKISSLNISIEEHPYVYPQELIDALEDYKNGKRNAKRRMYKYVNKKISEKYYNELIEKYGFFHRMNKAKLERKRKQKIKEALCVPLALIVLFGSMLITLGEIVVRDGKGPALVYIVLWFWALDYAFQKDSKSKTITKLQFENEMLKERIEIYKEGNKNLEFDKETCYEEKT